MKKCHFIKMLFGFLLLTSPYNSIRSIEIKRIHENEKTIEMKKDFLLIDI